METPNPAGKMGGAVREPELRRFWLRQNQLSVGSEILIEGEEYKHICIVCRMQEGAKFEVLNSDGQAFFSELVSVGKKSAVIHLTEVRDLPQQRKPWLNLCISVPKFSTFETILEKSVELGVKTITPMLSDYSFIKSASKISSTKWQRWQKIIISATRQTGRGDLMQLRSVDSLEQILKKFNLDPQAMGLFPYEGRSAQTIAQALERLNSHEFSEIWCFIGSEGGFSEKEVELFGENGLKPATLGEQVLRVETACLALSSIIKYHAGQLS